MHELSIAQNVIGFLRKEAEANGYRLIESVGLRIGELSDVVPEALSFGFEALTKDTDLEKTQLHIQMVPVTAECRKCRARFKVNDHVFLCTACGHAGLRVVEGQEIEIDYIEIADDNPDGKGD